MNQSVVSVGATRPLSGSVFGVTMDVRLAIVVEVGKARLTRFAFGSVPVLTDQRSTPHCAKSVCANTSSASAAVNENKSVRFIAVDLTLEDFAESRPPPRPIRQSSGARIIEL